MKTVAIISEYNPFHNGHLYQINKIREKLGQDTAIIAIMSGNYTQRGELAILDKWQRAKAAVSAGVNLVLELPFPYSAASAELFARAGVEIAEKTGVVDYLSFGSECGDPDLLYDYASAMLSDEFSARLAELVKDKENDSVGYPALYGKIIEEIFGKKAISLEPNDILATEYIKALLSINSSIKPLPIKRFGSGYNDEKITENTHQSAKAIREIIKDDVYSAVDYIPDSTFSIVRDAIEGGEAIFDCEQLSSAVLTKLRLSTTSSDSDIHDAGGGLYNRLVSKSYEATSISSLVDLSMTKKYTKARIRRAIWFSLLGVTSSEVKTMPKYTQALAFDSSGQALLRKIKKTGNLEILTKSSALPQSEPALSQRLLCDKADSVCQLTRLQKKAQGSIYRETPYVKS